MNDSPPSKPSACLPNAESIHTRTTSREVAVKEEKAAEGAGVNSAASKKSTRWRRLLFYRNTWISIPRSVRQSGPRRRARQRIRQNEKTRTRRYHRRFSGGHRYLWRHL